MNDQPVILQYNQNFSEDIISAISKDKDWIFIVSNEEKKTNYKKSLEQSISYVCYTGSSFCGYIRAILDEGMAIYISELYVLSEYRKRGIGQKLIEEVKTNNDTVTVYALSDEDLYYEKKGLKKVGSVYEI